MSLRAAVLGAPLVLLLALASMPLASAFCVIVEPPSSLPTQVNGTQVEIQLTEGYARIVIIKEFYNPSTITKEGQIFFPLERGHELITDLQMKIGNVVYASAAADREEALDDFLAAVQNEQDAALVQYDPAKDVYWVAAVIPPLSARTTVTTLELPLTMVDGFYEYTYRLTVDAGHSKQFLKLHLGIRTASEIREVSVPTHPHLEVRRDGDRNADVTIRNVKEARGGDLVVRFRTDSGSTSQHTDEKTGERYVRVSFDSNDAALRELETPRQRALLFAVDASGSMAQDDRWTSVREGVLEAIRDLGPTETFGIATTKGAKVRAFDAELVSGGPGTLRAVDSFLRSVRPHGSTNLVASVETIRGWAEQAHAAGLQPVLVVVSDGVPTSGVTVSTDLENVIEALSTDSSMPVFGMAIQPPTVDAFHQLHNLTHYSHGVLVTLRPGLATEEVPRMLDGIRVPVHEQVRISLPYEPGAELAGPGSEAVVRGGTITAIAKLPAGTSGPVTVRLEVTGANGQHLVLDRLVTDDPARDDPYLGRQWVLARIHHYLMETRGEHANHVLTDLKELALANRVVTPYTSLLIVLPPRDSKAIRDESLGSPPSAPARSASIGGGGFGGLPEDTALTQEERRARAWREDMSNPLVVNDEVDRYVDRGTGAANRAERDGRTVLDGTFLTIVEVDGELVGIRTSWASDSPAVPSVGFLLVALGLLAALVRTKTLAGRIARRRKE